MISLAYPSALLLAVLWLIVELLRRPRHPAVYFPSPERLEKQPVTLRQRLRKPLLFALRSAIVLLLALTAARPQRVHFLDLNRSGRDLVLALDISGSMSAKDFTEGSQSLTRIAAVRDVVTRFIAQRPYDRLGLILFGPRAFLQSPLTRDHQIITTFMDDLTAGATGDGTAIGDGIALALKRLDSSPERSRAVILVTDGANNSGRISPVDAALLAAEHHVVIHTIGIGRTSDQAPAAQYDEALLKRIATVTHGTFFNAATKSGLQDVYAQIDQLESSADDLPRSRQIEELYYLPAAAALVLYLIYLWCALRLIPLLP